MQTLEQNLNWKRAFICGRTKHKRKSKGRQRLNYQNLNWETTKHKYMEHKDLKPRPWGTWDSQTQGEMSRQSSNKQWKMEDRFISQSSWCVSAVLALKLNIGILTSKLSGLAKKVYAHWTLY